jgi:hypothetical protein
MHNEKQNSNMSHFRHSGPSAALRIDSRRNPLSGYSPSAKILDAGFHRHDVLYFAPFPIRTAALEYSVFEFCIEESLTQ